MINKGLPSFFFFLEIKNCSANVAHGTEGLSKMTEYVRWKRSLDKLEITIKKAAVEAALAVAV